MAQVSQLSAVKPVSWKQEEDKVGKALKSCQVIQQSLEQLADLKRMVILEKELVDKV